MRKFLLLVVLVVAGAVLWVALWFTPPDLSPYNKDTAVVKDNAAAFAGYNAGYNLAADFAKSSAKESATALTSLDKKNMVSGFKAGLYGEVQNLVGNISKGSGYLVAYNMGVYSAKKFVELKMGVDKKQFVLGFADRLYERASRYSDVQITAALEIFRQQQDVAKSQEKLAKSAEFFTANAKKKGVVTTKSGLQYKIMRLGGGNFKPGPDDMVKVHYSGAILSGLMFADTYADNEPVKLKVGDAMLGWIEALQLMSPGAKYEVYVPPNLADKAPVTRALEGSALVFVIELLEIIPSAKKK